MKIPLHSNICWGMAYGMLACCYDLRIVCSFYHYYQLAKLQKQPINLFISLADELFGLITSIRHTGGTVKHIPWTAFSFKAPDWECVNDMCTLVSCANDIQQINQPSGFPHLKSSRQHGRRSATPPDTGSSRMQSTPCLQKYRNITTSLTTRRSTSSCFVHFFTP